MSLDELLPTANWPAESGEYKVIQLEVDGKPYLCFGKTNQKSNTMESFSELHVNILASFLKASGREVPMMLDGCSFVPELESEWYKVYGAGRAEINVEQKKASFFGKSAGYGIYIAEEHLSLVKPLLPDWTLVKAEK